ncbi:TRAP transporter substrate-binding protein [Desulfocastanea catecholica]
MPVPHCETTPWHFPAKHQTNSEKTMRTKIAIFLSIIMMSGLFVGTAFAKIKLTFNNYFPPTHMASIMSAEWCQEIEKRTNGEVQFQHFAGGQLLQADKVFDGVVQGIADVGFSNLAYTRGRFPEMEMCDLPLGMPSAWVSSHVAQKYYEKYQPKEFDKAKVMYFSACGPNLISTTTKAVHTLEDLKGQTLRATGRIADTANALGATSRPMGIGETYEAVKKNVISGAMLPLETMKGFRLGEVLKYCTANWQVGNVYTFYAVMNKNKWNKLPDNIKKVFEEVNAEFIEKMAQGWNNIDLAGSEFFKSKGGQMIQLTESEAEKWNKAVAPVLETYTQQMVKAGYSVDDIKERFEFVKKTRDEFKALQLSKGIPVPYEQ